MLMKMYEDPWLIRADSNDVMLMKMYEGPW
jgi:hypothetical protein